MGHGPPGWFPWGPAAQACRCICITQRNGQVPLPLFCSLLCQLLSAFPGRIVVRLCSSHCFIQCANHNNHRVAKD